MKKLVLSFALFLSLGLAANAQAPSKFNYQGVARRIDGTPMVNTPIGLRLTIHEGSAAGTVDYQETQTTFTNTFGLYNVLIGDGAVNTAAGGAATLGAVNWGSGDKYLQVEIDPLGADNYSQAGTAQLMSVPFALSAGSAPANGVTSVTAGAGLNGGTITHSGTISMPNVGTPGTYGDGVTVPKITTDAQGRVTSVVNTPITAGAGTVTSINTGTGLTGGPITTSGTLSLATAGSAGTYGSSTTVPVFTTDAYGRVVSVTNTPITTAGTGTVTNVATGGGLIGGPITSTGTISMPLVGTAGTYGSSTSIPQITTDAYGRVTAVTVNTVTPGITSTGTANYIAKFTSPTNIANSPFYQSGNYVGLGTTTPLGPLDEESSTDTIVNWVVQNGTPTTFGTLRSEYNGTTDVDRVGVLATTIRTTADIKGVGVEGAGARLGVQGFSESDGFDISTGLEGDAYNDGTSIGVLGNANAELFGGGTNYGVVGMTDGSGLTDLAGYFMGDVSITGTLSKAAGTFKIDHPLDPDNKYLIHSFVESPDMMNIYNGNATTDGSGIAEITLPSYFEALNQDFRYQLTVMGGTFAQAIVSKEVAGNKFEIKTNMPNIKVSWQVTGIRHDAYANAHRVEPEKEKESYNKGKYINPVELGKSKSLQLGAVKVRPKGKNVYSTRKAQTNK